MVGQKVGAILGESKMILDENIIERFQWTRVGPVLKVICSDKSVGLGGI